LYFSACVCQYNVYLSSPGLAVSEVDMSLRVERSSKLWYDMIRIVIVTCTYKLMASQLRTERNNKLKHKLKHKLISIK